MMEIDEQVLLNEVNKIRLNKEERQNNQTQSTPPVSNTMSMIPEYPDIPGYQPIVEDSFLPPSDEAMPSLPDDMPPPPPPMEEYPAGETGPMDVPPPDFPPVQPPEVVRAAQPKRSPYEIYELTLLKYIVRYGEKVLFDYVDEETNEHIVMRVAEYIRYDLERDDLTFYTPIFKNMLDEAAERCKNEEFIANRYFLAHPDPNVSRLAANLISEKYQLSKYHSKYRELEQEEDKLDQLVIREIYAMKDAYIIRQIKETQLGIKEAHLKGNEDQVFELMRKLTHLNEIKNVLSKELGERIVLKM